MIPPPLSGALLSSLQALSPEAVGDVGEAVVVARYAVEALVGGALTQRSEVGAVGAGLDIVGAGGVEAGG